MLEVIENAIKSVLINYIGENFTNKTRYLNVELFDEKFVTERLGFI